jgi:ribonucleoside-diphosphate reductase alpha chain
MMQTVVAEAMTVSAEAPAPGGFSESAAQAIVMDVEATLATATAPATADTRRLEARMKGYEGECCSECGNYTMVRNGTCLKCDTCGSTNGCS